VLKLKILIIFFIVILISLIFSNIFPVSPWAKIYGNISGQESYPHRNFNFHHTLLPDSLVSLTSGFAVIIDKKAQKLYVYGTRNGQFRKVFETRCSTGKNQGDKLTSGDARTPEGIFFPTRKFTDDELTPIYGTLAFTLDYPNYFDKRTGKNGHNIWIHGTDKTLKSFQSNGCIVLDNSDILRLSEFIYLNKTPVIIVDSIQWVPLDSSLSLKSEIEGAMKKWENNVLAGNENAEDYIYIIHSAGEKVSRRQFLKQMRQIQTLARHFALEPKDVSILKQNDHAVVLFDQIISVENNIFQGVYMKLFLEKRDKQWLAMKDSNQAAPVILAGSRRCDGLPEGENIPVTQTTGTSRSDQTEPLTPIASVSPVHTEISKYERDIRINTTPDEKAISSLISRWARSWESDDMPAYQDCYAEDFRSRNMDLKSWIRYKKGLYERYRSIQVVVWNVDIKIYAEQGRATARFTQRYTAPGMNETGTKELRLIKIGNAWKISRERMVD